MRVRISSIKINPGRREAEPKAVEELARSITAVGLLNPITIDQNNTLVAGLHRLEAAKLLGWTEIECTAVGMNTVQAELESLGYTCTQYLFSDSNDIAAVVQTAADNSDLLYVPTDNTAASNTPIIDNICHGSIPVFAGEEGLAAGCGVATLSISYYDIGYKTGEMAAKILTGEADISTMPIAYAPEFVKKYNPPMCEALGLTPPEGYVAIEAAA